MEAGEVVVEEGEDGVEDGGRGGIGFVGKGRDGVVRSDRSGFLGAVELGDKVGCERTDTW